MSELKEAVVYARYSSARQSARSIDDQFQLCDKIAKQNGYKIVKYFKDAAIAGSGTLARDGWQAVMREAAAKDRTFEAVIIESQSRMSRDLADSARDFKRLNYRDIALIDLEGKSNTMRVGMSGIMNEEFRKHLGNMMRRAWDGRVKEGLMPGKPAYGHRKVPNTSFEREVDPDAAKIVNRIFTEYVNLEPVRDIAAGLNRDGILSPSGGKWNHTVFIAGGGNGKGIISNPIYIGELVWNTCRSAIHPDTEKRGKQKGKPDDLLTVPVPHLQIISRDLWDRAQQVRTNRSRQSGVRVYKKSIVNHMLAGRLVCGECNGAMKIVYSKAGEDTRVGCTNARNKGTCDNTKTYNLNEIESTVLHGIKHDLDVEALMAYTEGAHKEWEKRQHAASGDREKAERALNVTIEKINRIVDAMADGDVPLTQLKEKYRALELERAGHEEKVRMAEADGGSKAAMVLHPAVIKNFRKNLETMHSALTNTKLTDAEVAPFRVAFGNVFDRVVVHKTGKRKPVEVTPYARVSAIMAETNLPRMRAPEEVLEEQGLTNLFLATHGTLEQLGW
jgi:site-specific DNA recombinase